MKDIALTIAFDASPLLVNKTGVAYYTERLVEQMAKSNPSVKFVGFYYNFLSKYDSTHLKDHNNVTYRPINLLPSKLVFQLRRIGIEIPLELLVKRRVDFVIYDNFLGYPSLYKIPSAAIIHDLTYLDLPEYVAARNRSDLTKLVPKELKRSKFIITVSEFSKRRIKDVYGDKKDVLVTPIPPDKPVQNNYNNTQPTLGDLGIKKPYILFLGTIEPRKNIVSLIDAFLWLPEELQQKYTLVIAGRIGWNCDAEVQKLEEGKSEGKNIIHLGYVSDKQRQILYQEASLFVHASHYEGFGMPVLEAMSYGIPCAVSNIEVFHEVAHSGVEYFNQDSVEDISRVIKELLQDAQKRIALGEEGKTVADKMSWGKVAQEVMAKIQEFTK